MQCERVGDGGCVYDSISRCFSFCGAIGRCIAASPHFGATPANAPPPPPPPPPARERFEFQASDTLGPLPPTASPGSSDARCRHPMALDAACLLYCCSAKTHHPCAFYTRTAAIGLEVLNRSNTHSSG